MKIIPPERTIRFGIVGSGYISQVHADSLRRVPGTTINWAWSRSAERARAFADANGIPRATTSWREIVEADDVDAVCVNTPNYLHGAVILAAAAAGKHVICEKPLTLDLDEARACITACRDAGVILGYAEELCFVPKFVRAKQLLDQGTFGDVYMVRQSEKHAGPYSPWFFQRDQAGGGIVMDMGCHAIEYCRWLLGKPKVEAVTAHMATYLHGAVTELEDHVIAMLEIEGGKLAVIESSWALKGGMSSIVEIYGTAGVLKTDLTLGSGIQVFSEIGYDGAGDERRGWSSPMYEELWQNGYPQEMQHFVDCIRSGAAPMESGEDGLAVLEIMLAAYASAAEGRRVPLPYAPPPGTEFPVDLWLARKRR